MSSQRNPDDLTEGSAEHSRKLSISAGRRKRSIVVGIQATTESIREKQVIPYSLSN